MQVKNKPCKGQRLRLGFVYYKPFIFEDPSFKNSLTVDHVDGRRSRLVGLDINKIKLLMEDMNFTAVWHTETQFGILDGNRWTGLVGGLTSNTFNMTANTITGSQQRSQVISLSFPTQRAVVKLHLQRPVSYSNNWYTFVMVFHLDYWIFLACVTLAFATGIVIFGCIVDRRAKILVPFLDALGNTLKAFGTLDAKFTIQDQAQKMVSFKLYCLTILLFFAFNYWLYNAALTSYLTVARQVSPINGLRDILNDPKYTLVVMSGTADESYFMDATDYTNPVAKALWEARMKDNPSSFVKSNSAGEMRVMNNPNDIFFAHEGAANSMDNFPCKMIQAKESYFKQFWSFGLSKNSSLEKVLNYRLFVARQSGVWNSEINDIAIPKSVTCDNIFSQNPTGFRELGYENIFSAFVILVSGTGTSMVIVLLEQLHRQVVSFFHRYFMNRQWP